MAAGIPLNDEDRWDWLILLRDQAIMKLKDGAKGVVRARKGHYMKDSMVESQFASLEEPDETECKQLKDVEIIDVKGSIQDVQVLAGAAVDKVLAQ